MLSKYLKYIRYHFKVFFCLSSSPPYPAFRQVFMYVLGRHGKAQRGLCTGVPRFFLASKSPIYHYKVNPRLTQSNIRLRYIQSGTD